MISLNSTQDDAPTDFLRRLFDAYAAFEAVTLVLPTLMQHPDWRYPYAGLRLVGIAAEYLEVRLAPIPVSFSFRLSSSRAEVVAGCQA
jgi:hypothetical protein